METGEGQPWGYNMAHFLILKRIKQALGLDQVKLLGYGAAPMKRSTLEYFLSLDMQLFNYYGMTESAATQTISWKKRVRFGKCG